MRRSAVSVALIFGFLGALSFEALSQAQGVSTLDLTLKDPAKTYFSLKKSFGAIPKDILLPPGRKSVMLSSCVGTEDLYGMSALAHHPLTGALADLAFEILVIQGSLAVGGYPTQLLSGDVSNLEQQALAELKNLNGKPPPDEPISEQSRIVLAQKANDYRKSHPAAMQVLPSASECGDMMGPTLVIATTPTAKQIQYMSQHFADLCADQGFSFSDEQCDSYWTDYSDALMLRGTFEFAFHWPSGPVTYRKWDLDTIKSNDDGATIKVQVSQ